LTNVHSLKEKKKNISHTLGREYKRKRDISNKIEELEKAKLDVKTLIDVERAKNNLKGVNKKVKQK